MSLPGYVPGLPGIRTALVATHRVIFKGGVWDFVDLPLGKIIDGANSRDSSNTGDLDVLRPGLLMGKITATGLYAPSILGVISGAYTSGGTQLTVSLAQAAEIVRRVGSSGTGTLKAIGPPTANGINAVTAITYSAIDVTTGIITVTSLGVNKVAGTLITAADGTQVPTTVIPDGYGIKVTDIDGTTNLSVPFPQLPIGGTIISANLLPVVPTDTTIQAYIEASGLNLHGQFVFDWNF